MIIRSVGYFRCTLVYVTDSTRGQWGFGTPRERTWVEENCCKGRFCIVWNACTRQVNTCVAKDCCEGSSVILRNLLCSVEAVLVAGNLR